MFIGISVDKEEISATSKLNYKKKIKSLVQRASLRYLSEEKLKHRKLDLVNYTQLKVQPYLISSHLSNAETEIAYALRSHCHKSKLNFKKLHGRDLSCSLGCSEVEDQSHIFSKCRPIFSKLNITQPVSYHDIFGTLKEHIKVIPILMNIDKTRKHMKNHLLPGGVCSQDPCKFSL